MTFRERLADWISGGALTRSADIEKLHDSLWEAMDEISAFRRALRDIAAMETPGANATVRRMAATAREALK